MIEPPPTPCPVCREQGGFHNTTIHAEHLVPASLTWKAGELPPWKREEEEDEAGQAGRV